MNHKKSEVYKMVCFNIVACLDPAHSRKTVAAIPPNSGQNLPKLKKNPEFHEIAATVFLLSVGSKHATIIQQTIL